MAEWTCTHGTTYTGPDDFISGARNAHSEIENRATAGRERSQGLEEALAAIRDHVPAAGYWRGAYLTVCAIAAEALSTAPGAVEEPTDDDEKGG